MRTAVHHPHHAEITLSNIIVDYWTSFASEHSPVSTEAPQWPLYDPAADNAMRLDTGSNLTVVSGIHTSLCDLWDEYRAAVPLPN